MKCKGCNIDQDKNPYKSRLFFTPDGYCTNCNHKYRDRIRTRSSGMDNFVKTIKIKEGKYNHIDSTGRKITPSRIMSLKNPNPSDYRKAKNKGITKLDQFQ